MQHLADVLASIERVESYLRGADLDTYRSDPQLRDAVERRLMIIGEAMSRLRRDDASVFGQVGDASRIVAFRNVVVHGYDALRHETVWQIITDDLPRLRADVEGLGLVE